MRILFCGLGSIGQRHLLNLQNILHARGIHFSVDALRATNRPLPEAIAALITQSYNDIEQLPAGYDIAFITNPTAQHEQTLRALGAKAAHLFVEKPVFSRTGVELDDLELAQGFHYVACPLRHHPVFLRLRELVDQHRVIAVRAVCSSYLPDWRAGTDYRAGYSAKREEGGGVPLDIIHEWDYLYELFGQPEEVRGFAAHCSPLEIDSDDVAVYIARYPEMLLSLQLDYVGRVPQRQIELYCENEVIAADFIAGSVALRKNGAVQMLTPVDIHRAEMEYFIDALISGGHNISPLSRANDVLKIALSVGEQTA